MIRGNYYYLFFFVRSIEAQVTTQRYLDIDRNKVEFLTFRGLITASALTCQLIALLLESFVVHTELQNLRSRGEREKKIWHNRVCTLCVANILVTDNLSKIEGKPIESKSI